jgi:hypothetical protein
MIYIHNCTSSLIFFALLGQKSQDACLPAGRQRRPKCQNINLALIIFLSFLPIGKVADNFIFYYSLLETFPRDLPTEKVGDRRKRRSFKGI